ncbi:hypothetical protein [uncultured Paracoccus sp.]|jgi:hypothetical protein|uniref:hypothetical protein n=1 Tax=uncultured Paracoccus sp. TaxID=189685 RepID=UPI0030DCAC59|tara:strand:- start:14551 stop:14991 length:441 start_codon:yes stop_codon:yes gene_type:complete
MSDSNMIRALMRPLIQKAGGLMPAATIIDAALGLPLDRDGLSRRKSTLWRRQEGELEWPMVEVWALEDALGDRPVSNWRARNAAAPVKAGCILDILSEACSESGDAFAAITSFIAGKGSRERALSEIEESIAAKKRLRDAIDQDNG